MSELSADREQEVFDHAEDIALHLHHLQGCLHALYPVVEADLAAADDKGIKTYALLASVEHFRLAAAQSASRVARLVSGLTA